MTGSGLRSVAFSMSDKPSLSVLIPWYERDELEVTLAANGPFFRAQEAEVLILNCGGDSGRLQALIAASGVSSVRQLNISTPRFNKSLALNIGLSQSRSDIVLTLDADIVMLDDSVRKTRMLPEDGSFVTIEWVYESDPAATGSLKHRDIGNTSTIAVAPSAIFEFRFRGGTTVQHQLSRRDALGNRHATPGLLLAKKCELLQVQGYNSELEGWGWEDDDVLVRLQYAVGLRRVLRGAAFHLTHSDDRRILQGSRKQSSQRNFLKCCRNYNHGLFLGTYGSDVTWAADKVTETLTG